MQGIYMDVGSIVAQIRGVFSKPRGNLFLPSIMMKLCANMGFMEGESEVAMNEIITNKVVRWLLRDFPHLSKASKTKKRAAKSHELPSPQPPPQKEKKVGEEAFQDLDIELEEYFK